MSEGNKGILFAIMGVIVIPIGAAFLASALFGIEPAYKKEKIFFCKDGFLHYSFEDDLEIVRKVKGGKNSPITNIPCDKIKIEDE